MSGWFSSLKETALAASQRVAQEVSTITEDIGMNPNINLASGSNSAALGSQFQDSFFSQGQSLLKKGQQFSNLIKSKLQLDGEECPTTELEIEQEASSLRHLRLSEATHTLQKWNLGISLNRQIGTVSEKILAEESGGLGTASLVDTENSNFRLSSQGPNNATTTTAAFPAPADAVSKGPGGSSDGAADGGAGKGTKTELLFGNSSTTQNPTSSSSSSKGSAAVGTSPNAVKQTSYGFRALLLKSRGIEILFSVLLKFTIF